MTPLTELIAEWETFAAGREDISVEVFCRHYLAKKKKRSSAGQGMQPFRLSRAIGRVAAIQRFCLKLALKELPGIEPEWYYFLHNINTLKEIRKTDIISINLLLEPTTGIDILNRMIRAGLLDEQTDPTDKRARLITVTKEGKLVLDRAERLVQQIARLLFGDITPEELQSMESYLTVIENTFGKILTDNKPKTLDDLLLLRS